MKAAGGHHITYPSGERRQSVRFYIRTVSDQLSVGNTDTTCLGPRRQTPLTQLPGYAELSIPWLRSSCRRHAQLQRPGHVMHAHSFQSPATAWSLGLMNTVGRDLLMHNKSTIECPALNLVHNAGRRHRSYGSYIVSYGGSWRANTIPRANAHRARR
jgi:hypothetical protein